MCVHVCVYIHIHLQADEQLIAWYGMIWTLVLVVVVIGGSACTLRNEVRML